MPDSKSLRLKEHLEFVMPDLDNGWENIPGYPPGIKQKILSGWLDEKNHKGSRTRLLRFDPGAFSTVPFVHEYWEEVLVVTGILLVQGKACGPMTYACRPPHVQHGPFRSDTGCILFEIHFFHDD